MQVKYEPWTIKNEKMDEWGFRIDDGEFAGTVISIKNTSITEEGEMALEFNFIATPPEKTSKELESQEFNQVLEYILNDILTKAVNEFENRDNNSSESN